MHFSISNNNQFKCNKQYHLQRHKGKSINTRIVFSTNGTGTIGCSHAKSKPSWIPQTLYNNKSKCKCKTIKLLDETIEENIFEFGLGKQFLDTIAKAQIIKVKELINLTLLKLETCSAFNIVKRKKA